MRLKHYLDQGVSKAELARRFGVSERTIHYWIAKRQLVNMTSTARNPMPVQSLPEHPMLQGPFQPLRDEHELHDLPVVQGEIPRDISGAYYRIGPNLKYRPRQGVYGFHMGDGMAYGLYLENGRAHFRKPMGQDSQARA